MEKLEIEIGADVSPLKKSLGVARDDIKWFKERAKSDTAIELSIKVAKLKADLHAVKQMMKEDIPPSVAIQLSAKSELLKKEITQAGRELTNFLRTGEADVSVLGKLFDSVKGTAISFASIIGGAVVGAVGVLGAKILNLWGNLEQAQISFTTMLGSADKAKTLLADLAEFAKTTPFELTGLRDNAKQLLAMGVAQENLIPTMRALGDIASGLNVPLERLALAYGQVLAKGRLQGEELLQFTEAGVPLLETLSKQLGKSTGELQKMIENGQIGAKEVTKAFISMSGEGGKFAGLMEKQSKSMKGMYSNLIDSITQIGERIGANVVPQIGASIEKLVSFINRNGDAIVAFATKIVEGIQGIFGAIGLIGTMVAETFNGISWAIGSAIDWVEKFTGTADRNKDIVELSKWSVYDYKTAIEALAKTQYAPNTEWYQRERAEIIKNIEASIQLLKAKRAVWAIQAQELARSKPVSGAGSTAPLSSNQIPGSGIKLNLGSIAGANGTQSALDSFTKASSQFLADPIEKQIKEYQDALKNIDKTIEDIRKGPSGINLDLIGNSSGGKGGGKWKSAESIAKEALDKRKKILEQLAEAEVRAVNNSTLSEVEKARKIVAINTKLKEDLELLDGDYVDLQVKKSQAVIENEEKATERLKKIKEQEYSDTVDLDKKRIDNINKVAKAYQDLQKKLQEETKKGTEEIKKMNDEISELQKKLADTTAKGQADIALRGAEAQKELKALQTKQYQGGGLDGEEVQRMFDLMKEIEFVNANTTGAERAKALLDVQKSKAELLADELKANQEKIKQEIAEAEIKKKNKEAEIALTLKGIKDEMDAKALYLVREVENQVKADEARRKIEEEYTKFFKGEIEKRAQAVKDLAQAVATARLEIQTAGIDQNTVSTAQGNSTAVNIVNNIANNVDYDSSMRRIQSQLTNK